MKKVTRIKIDAVTPKVKLLTGPMVAKAFGCDLKTIHNWVNNGKLKAFRTPGRHLRFRVVDVIDALEQYRYDVPQWITDYEEDMS